MADTEYEDWANVWAKIGQKKEPAAPALGDRCMKPVYALMPALGQTAYLDWPAATFTPCQLDAGHGGECKTERGEPAAPAAPEKAICRWCGKPLAKAFAGTRWFHAGNGLISCVITHDAEPAPPAPEQELANWRKVSGYDSPEELADANAKVRAGCTGERKRVTEEGSVT